MSMAVLEGMAWGLAVVSSSAGGADEFLRSQHNCLLVQPGDVASIARAIETLVLDRYTRSRLGANARETARLYSLDSYIKSLTRLYSDAAALDNGKGLAT